MRWAGAARHSRFDVGVGVAVGVHGGQVGAADDAHQQALLLRAVLEGDEDPAALLQRLVLCFIYLGGGTQPVRGCSGAGRPPRGLLACASLALSTAHTPRLKADQTLPAGTFQVSHRPPPRQLTGSCFSRQMLKFLVWLGFSFFSGIRVSPMNSLWRNLSSSHTEILKGAWDSMSGAVWGFLFP